MNINSLTSSSSSTTSLTGNATTSSQSTTATNAVSPVLQKLVQRVQTDMDATKAQLSSFGLLKSAVATSQSAAQALGKLSATSSADDVTKAVGVFFNAFNGVAAAAKTAASGTATLAASQAATRVDKDMQRALSNSPAMTDAMKLLGLRLQSDGTLTHDAKKFAASLQSNPAAVRAALAKLGQKVDAAASNELANNGNVTDGVSNLNQHNTGLTAQQKALAQAVQAAQAKLSSASVSSGLAAYAAQSKG
jgi:flagellar capping protein FliD